MKAKVAYSWICLLLGVLVAIQGAPSLAVESDLLERHKSAMFSIAETFARSTVQVEFIEGAPVHGKSGVLRWQDGMFRIEHYWLGFTEVFGYDGREHWYGSDINLPYALDQGHGMDITPQLVSNFAYLSPGLVDYLGPAGEVPLELAKRYPVLSFAPPRMSEVLLLLDPFDLKLAAMVQGNEKRLDQSILYKLTYFDGWTDYAGVWYPRVLRHKTLSHQGETLRERVFTTKSVAVVPALGYEQFQRGSTPAIVQPELPSVPYVLKFYYQNDKVVLRCKGENGRRLRLEIDTGANVGLLRNDTVRRLGLTPVGDEQITGHGGTADVQYVRVENILLEGQDNKFEVALPAYPAAVVIKENSLEQSLADRGIDGLIGTFLLNSFVVRFDYRNKLLYLYPPEQFNPEEHLGAGYHAIPVHRDAMPWVEVNVDGELKGGAFFNSGAQQYFTLSLWALDAAGMNYEIERIGTGATIGGTTIFGIIRPGEVDLNGYKVRNPETHLEMLASVEAPNPHRIASFGNEFFRGKVVTYDLFHGYYYIEADD